MASLFDKYLESVKSEGFATHRFETSADKEPDIRSFITEKFGEAENKKIIVRRLNNGKILVGSGNKAVFQKLFKEFS